MHPYKREIVLRTCCYLFTHFSQLAIFLDARQIAQRVAESTRKIYNDADRKISAAHRVRPKSPVTASKYSTVVPATVFIFFLLPDDFGYERKGSK